MDLIACPQCDALYQAPRTPTGETAVCARCHTVLAAPRERAALHVAALALAVLILLAGGVLFPFLEVRAAGLSNRATVLDAAFAFQSGPLLVLSAGVAAFIVAIPALRVTFLLYAMLPLAVARPPLSGALRALRWSEAMRPWSMAEIFVLGCAVALIKVSDLARVGFGPAFWMFAALVALMMVQDRFICRWSLWTALATPPAR